MSTRRQTSRNKQQRIEKDLEKKLFNKPGGPNSDARVSQTQKRILQAKLERGEAADAPANVNPKWFKFCRATRSHLARLRLQVAACMVDLHAETLSEPDLAALVDDVVGPPSDTGFFLLVDYLGYPVAHVMVLYEKREHLLEWRISSFYVEPAFRKQGYFCMFFYYLRDLAMNENLPGNALRLSIPFDEVKNQETFLDPRTINTWRSMAVRRRRAEQAMQARVMQLASRDWERAIPLGGLRRDDFEEWWTYDLPKLRSDASAAIANKADMEMPELVSINHTNAQCVIDENLDNHDVCPFSFHGDDMEEYDIEQALMVLPELKMLEIEPRNPLKQYHNNTKSVFADFEAHVNMVRWHSDQQFDAPVKDDDPDDEAYCLPTLEELEHQLMAVPRLQMRRLVYQDFQATESAFQSQKSNGGRPNAKGLDVVPNHIIMQQQRDADEQWDSLPSAMYNTNDSDNDKDDTYSLPASQYLETQPALVPSLKANGLETMPKESHQLCELWNLRSSMLSSQVKIFGRGDPAKHVDADNDGLYELPVLEDGAQKGVGYT